MKIVHVLNSLTLGGREKLVIDICNVLALTNNEIFIITLTDDKNEILNQLHERCTVISLPYKTSSLLSKIKFWLFGRVKFTKLLNKINPDIVHSHLYYHDFLFLTLSIKSCNFLPKHFRTVHTSGLFYDSKTILNRFRLFIEIIATKIHPLYYISISKTVHRNNKKIFSKYSKDIRLISNGINLNKFSKSNYTTITKENFNINEDKIVVTYVARLDMGKNHECLLKAWQIVTQKYNNVVLLLIGEGNLKDDLVNKTIELNIEKNVIFFGSSNKIPELLSISDLGVFPSQFEGFGISLVEKMAMEVPVIASNIDVFKEMIIENENGILYEVNNSKKLAHAIIDLIVNKEKRIDIGKSGRITAEQYDIKDIAKQTLAYYGEGLAK